MTVTELRPAELFEGEEYAACRASAWEVFFPARGRPTEPAKAICATCRVRQPCQDYAIPNEKVGVWGGMSERQRRRARRELRLPEPHGEGDAGPVPA